VQIVLVGNIITVENFPTHTGYMLDDAMGKPVHVRVWKVGNNRGLDLHEIWWVMRTHSVWYCHLSVQSDGVCLHVWTCWPVLRKECCRHDASVESH